VATEPGERAQLWRHREAATEAVAAEAARTGHPVRKLDVAVPPRQLPDFAEELPTAVAAASPGARVLAFGHVGDGNLHVQLLDVPDERCEPCEDAVFERVVARGGSISAEHGIGVAKRRWLERARSPEAVAAMRAVKRALDPSGRLNPGVLVEP
jgi:FAD/FMN-containing dehydrogenase